MSEITDKIEAAFKAVYSDGVAVLEQQPAENRGAIIVLSLLDEDMIGQAYGSPEQWVKMLVGVGERNKQFNLALQMAGMALKHGIRLDGDED